MNRRSLVGRSSNRVSRAIKVAYTNMKSKLPRDTGTLQNALTLNTSGSGYNISFKTDRMNPKSKKPLRSYIDYVEIYHSQWWENSVKQFFAELSRTTKSKVKKK